MRNELEEKLFLEFPDLFAGRHLPLTENLMGFGCECGDGWFNLLYDLCTELERQIQLEIATPDYPRTCSHCYNHADTCDCTEFELLRPIVEQVKEKFGELRFYVTSCSAACYEIINHYENLSWMTCEICGDRGATSSRGSWLRTLCAKCADENSYKETST